VNLPPWIHTITGNPIAEELGVQTFTVSHSSVAVTSSG
jgi:hypothetical protein